MYTAIIRKGTAFTMTLLLVTATSWILPDESEARKVRNTTRSNVNRHVNHNRGGNVSANRGRNVSANRNVNRNRNVNYNRNVNRSHNVNIDRDIDIDVDHDYRGYYGGGYHPIATAAAVTAAATVTAAAIGSIVYSLPPACSAVVVNGFTYQNCGGTWYQPQYTGSQVSYVVVNAP